MSTPVPEYFQYIGNPPVFGVGYEVPNSKPPSVCSFQWDWTSYEPSFPTNLFTTPVVVQCTCPSAGVSGAGLDFVKSVYIDNTANYFPVSVKAKDTQHTVVCAALSSGWFPLMTNQFNFDVMCFQTYGSRASAVLKTPIQVIFSNTVVPGELSPNESTYDLLTELVAINTNIIAMESNLQTIHDALVNASTVTQIMNSAVPASATTILGAVIPALNKNIMALTGFNLTFDLTAATFAAFYLYDTITGVSIPLWAGDVLANTNYTFNSSGMQLPLSGHAYDLTIRNFTATAAVVRGNALITYTAYN